MDFQQKILHRPLELGLTNFCIHQTGDHGLLISDDADFCMAGLCYGNLQNKGRDHQSDADMGGWPGESSMVKSDNVYEIHIQYIEFLGYFTPNLF